MELTENELKEVLRLHRMWLDDNRNGKCADLSGADLSGVALSGVDLSWADMHDANLREADLGGAKLYNADLCVADLSGANLSTADLCTANLSGANLSGADLRWADLRCADLVRTCLRDVNLGYNACFAGAVGAPVYQATCGFGSRNATLTLLAQGKREEWRWFTGCFKGSEDDLRIAVLEKHGGTQEVRRYLRAIDYLIAQAEDNENIDNVK